MDMHVTATDGTRGRLRFGELAFDCALGKSGITLQKREGDGATPAGRFPLRGLHFRADKMSPPATSLVSRPIEPEDGWCDDPGSEAYNRPVRLPFAARHETLWRGDDLYDLVVVLGHNDDPPVKGAGSCIFMHVARPDYGPTEGCVALKKADLLALLAALEADSALHIHAG
ncbi:MAG: hypothetical protein CMN55_09255 [Sneathiella sp.]|jgi:L,D-peptidoglycan transpeptidase YkuD (ErfK/YbiS/YcfS/YnhG family)|uniref:L,D-transpeptidase family protein n=1 Tax=Sneathiella sp. TaxID=1964365 RepID=UPI000C3FBB84|nr:L,D-transpeptidase family protein [Sneathiella sp.]MAL79284.1 hypothetical protein [Sneathiella sp.]|tara:strand:- start:22 stop:534 length:513 start_codon:yes stop_codon:yes gene_type:complete